MASVRRYEDIVLSPVSGVPSHMMMDPVARVLYLLLSHCCALVCYY